MNDDNVIGTCQSETDPSTEEHTKDVAAYTEILQRMSTDDFKALYDRFFVHHSAKEWKTVALEAEFTRRKTLGKKGSIVTTPETDSPVDTNFPV